MPTYRCKSPGARGTRTVTNASVSWEWKGDMGKWTGYEPALSARIEQARLEGRDRFPLGVREIEFSSMRQYVVADRTRFRPVRRTVIPEGDPPPPGEAGVAIQGLPRQTGPHLTATQPAPHADLEPEPEPEPDQELYLDTKREIARLQKELQRARAASQLQSHTAAPALTLQERQRAARKDPVYVPDDDPVYGASCMICGTGFGFVNQRHHCRYCGWLICSTCSPGKLLLDRHIPVKGRRPNEPNDSHRNAKGASEKPRRVCSECEAQAQAE
eukprot:COSAG03_NODE_4706_length_1460_cov_1.457017_1_plen_271_part_10